MQHDRPAAPDRERTARFDVERGLSTPPRPPPVSLAAALALEQREPLDLEPRDTVRTEVPDFPPEVLATYERHVREEAEALARTRPSAPVRDVYPKAGPNDTIDLDPMPMLSDELVTEPPAAAAPRPAASAEPAAAWAEPSAAWAEPAAIAYEAPRRRRRRWRVSRPAAVVGGLVALAGGAGLFAVVSTAARQAPAPTRSGPTRVVVTEHAEPAHGEAFSADGLVPRREVAPTRSDATAAAGHAANGAAGEAGAAGGAPGADGAETPAAARPDGASAAPPTPLPPTAHTPSRGAPAARAAPAATDAPVARDEVASDQRVAEAVTAHRGGDSALALRHLEEALALDGRNPRAFEWLARVHLARGAAAEAEVWVNRATELRPRRASYQRLRADVLEALGHTAAAAAARADADDLERR